MLIEIDENSNICRITRDGVSNNFYVNELMAVFAHNDDGMKITDVPEGTRRVIEYKNTRVYVFTIPEGIKPYTMQYNSHDYDRFKINKEFWVDWNSDDIDNLRRITVNIPQPALVIACVFKVTTDNKLSFVQEYAFASDNINKADVGSIDLYPYPFTNVYSDRHVCTGEIGVQEFNMLQAREAPSFLTKGIGNHDLERDYPDEARALGVRRSYDAIAYLANHPEILKFPKEWLGDRLYTIAEAQRNWLH